MRESIISLKKGFTQIHITDEEKKATINAAYWVTASVHEHVWTLKQQQLMAHYCLWACQKLEAVDCVLNMDLRHERDST